MPSFKELQQQPARKQKSHGLNIVFRFVLKWKKFKPERFKLLHPAGHYKYIYIYLDDINPSKNNSLLSRPMGGALAISQSDFRDWEIVASTQVISNVTSIGVWIFVYHYTGYKYLFESSNIDLQFVLNGCP